MPTELEELVEFLHHGNAQIRQAAVEHLVGYSSTEPSIFKSPQMVPVKDLKLLVKDYAPIAKNAISILINISADREVLDFLATDDDFLESILFRITNPKAPNANELCMLIANLAKHESIERLLTSTRVVPKTLSSSDRAIDQLLDAFVKGAAGSYNKNADYDYLAYLFADLAKYEKGRLYFLSPRQEDGNIIPLTKLVVFTEHKSKVRRQGVASTIKNVAFEVDAHTQLMAADQVNLLPYVILPIMGSEEYDDEDTEGMLEDLQLLPPDKEREQDFEILKTHLETLLLLTTTSGGRTVLKDVKLYPIVRETHLHVENEEVREACDRIVQVIMRDEVAEQEVGDPGPTKEVDSDEEIVDLI